MTLINEVSIALISSPELHQRSDLTREKLLSCLDDIVKLDPEFILKVRL